MRKIYELEVCLELRKRLNDIEEQLEEMRSNVRFPKIQTISDMPRGSVGENSIERYITKSEEYDQKRLSIKESLDSSWEKAMILLSNCGVESDAIRLMYFRFYCGFSWNKSTSKMRREYGEKWNENRAFRTYRNIVNIVQIVQKNVSGIV